MNLYAYLQTLNRYWNNGDGSGVAKLLSMNGNHTNNPAIHVEHPEDTIERVLTSPIDEVVCYHIQVLFYLNSERKLIIF